MIKITQKLETADKIDATLSLPIDQRIKSRLRTELADGTELGLFLPRGLMLRGGDLIATEDGSYVVQVEAAPETVSTVTAPNAHLLLRCAYHLGNRHVPLQVETHQLRYQHDHVLDDMVRGLGAEVVCEQAPFEPEAGAYGGGHAHAPSHSHGHSHSHSHSHSHDHEHTHDHDGHSHHH